MLVSPGFQVSILHRCILVDNKISMSTKRIRSSGDGPHGGGISVKSAKKADKFNCTVCSKLISRKTKHPASACQNYINRSSTDNSI